MVLDRKASKKRYISMAYNILDIIITYPCDLFMGKVCIFATYLIFLSSHGEKFIFCLESLFGSL